MQSETPSAELPPVEELQASDLSDSEPDDLPF